MVLQRPGVARVLVDNFESLDASRWTTSGKVSLVDQPHLSERKSLRIPSGGASIAHSLDEPLAAGRLELAYHDDGLVAAGLRWSIELTFQGPSGATLLRVVPGWSDESLAVEMPSFPALAVQRLARTPGWHRFMLRFSPENTEISVDGKELAHGKAPEGLLVSIRLASSVPAAGGQAPGPSKTPVCHIDDLQLTRFAEPSTGFELDVKQDEARLVVGDQLFGKVQKADSENMSMAVEGKSISLPWGQISGLHFRREAAFGAPVEGLLARVEWRSAPGEDPDQSRLRRRRDHGGRATAASPLRLRIPASSRSRGELVHSLVIRGHGRWYLIDATAHHLGDEFSTAPPVLDPPAPEGGVLEKTIELPDLPDGSWSLVVDVVQMVG